MSDQVGNQNVGFLMTRLKASTCAFTLLARYGLNVLQKLSIFCKTCTVSRVISVFSCALAQNLSKVVCSPLKLGKFLAFFAKRSVYSKQKNKKFCPSLQEHFRLTINIDVTGT